MMLSLSLPEYRGPETEWLIVNIFILVLMILRPDALDDSLPSGDMLSQGRGEGKSLPQN